jgi:hypothetical protein
MRESIIAKEVFADALEVEPVGRDVFVRDACAGNAALLADVLGLIATHDQAKNFLSVPAISGVESLGEGPGTVIGNSKCASMSGKAGSMRTSSSGSSDTLRPSRSIRT